MNPMLKTTAATFLALTLIGLTGCSADSDRNEPAQPAKVSSVSVKPADRSPPTGTTPWPDR